MDGGDRLVRRRMSLKERLSFKRINCCGGATWGLVPTTISVRDDDEDDDVVEVPQAGVTEEPGAQSPPGNSEPLCEAEETPTGSGMNLAAALAAERQYRAVQDPDGEGQGQSESESQTPVARMSLMRLLEETDGCDGEITVTETGNDGVCCVCMWRKKGAAFIPCGHTFCRVCSRETWRNRGSCPLCNRSILEILDIY